MLEYLILKREVVLWNKNGYMLEIIYLHYITMKIHVLVCMYNYYSINNRLYTLTNYAKTFEN